MGALVVQKYLETHDAPAVVLLAPSPPYGLFGASRRLMRNNRWPSFVALVSISLWPFMSSPERAGRLLISAPRTPARLRALHALLQDESICALVQLLWPRLSGRRRQATPALVLGASAAAILEEADVRAAAGVYGQEAGFVDGCAHDIMLDTAWPLVAKQVHEWLELNVRP
jgi:alpha-beta hydrolase superfamily lysophospholipase